MSKEVDERVVEMRFDNAKFEKNTRQTMKTLQELNESLKLKGAEKGFEKIEDASAKVDFDKCVACGACVDACPKHIIRIVPLNAKKYTEVACSSHDKGAVVRQACDNGCIGCKMCEKTCKFDAIHVVDGVAKIDYDKCKNCKMCTKVCPKGCIEPVPTEEEKAKFKEMQAKQAAAAKAKAEAAKQAAEAKAAEDK